MQIVACRQCGAKNRVEESKLANSAATCGRCGTRLETNANTNGNKPVVVTDATFQREVLDAVGPPVLLDCWAPWCGPCRVIAPVMDQLAAESQGRYRVAKLNVDENPETASRYQIASIPTMLIFKNGKLIDRIIGGHPKQTIAERLARAA